MNAPSKAFATALVALLAVPAQAQSIGGPFVAKAPSFDEAWRYACWDKAQFQGVAHDCLTQGRNVDYRWTADWLKEVDAATPAKIEEIGKARSDYASRQNMAYRTLIGRNIAPDEAIVICRDKNSVDAIINSVAGLQPAPNVIIENRKTASAVHDAAKRTRHGVATQDLHRGSWAVSGALSRGG
jgi:hypothetical protein